MELLPQYDQLWVVSDIHMGGERADDRNFQIFRRGERLARLIRRLATDRPGDTVALVLNGDIIDSLAEDIVTGYVALDVDTAIAMMERIRADPSFSPVWDALGEFVRTAKRHLVLVIGNHDIELALEPVQAWIRAVLGAGDAEAGAGIVFSTRGGGFACRVGTKRVFCTHGNEIDGWNTVDYNRLGQLDNAMNAGRRELAAEWTPNAGTRMVIDLMNAVKKRYPFVDLLKPETKPVLSTLLTLDRSLVKLVDLGPAYSVVRELMRGSSEVKHLLGGGRDLEDISPAILAAAAADKMLGKNLIEGVREARKDGQEDAHLLAAADAVAKRRPATAALDSSDESTLGWTDIVFGWLGQLTPEEALRRALLDWLGSDPTFDLTHKDFTFTKIVERVGPNVDFVVTGHTHLARSIEFAPGRRYFNCGTWIRLLRLTHEVLDNPGAFEKVFLVFKAGTMKVLDDASIPGPKGNLPLVLDRTNAVRISRTGDMVTGELLRVVDTAVGTKVDYAPETGGLE